MSELTLFVLRIGFLIALWVFVFFVIFALRSDLFGQKVRRINSSSASGTTAAAAGTAGSAASNSAFLTSAQPTVSPAKVAHSKEIASALGAPLRLVVTSGNLAGQELELGQNDVTIGRSTDSTLVIQDDYTSTHHANLEVKNGSWMLTDLESTNGTFLDGERVNKSVPIPLNTPITVGSVTFEIRR